MADTTARVLRLLAHLESRPTWTAGELSARLEVTQRTIRRDVERLRELGYPVHAERGVGGGYRLGAGGRLPPLVLDDREAVATAVCLRLGAVGSVEALAEPAMRTLTKLDQVLPPGLRAEVAAVAEGTVTLPGLPATVDPDVLVTLARAARDRVRARFSYEARDGAATQRDIEPYRLVTTGRRWYLLAYDPDRQDWRTFRLDRMSDVRASTFRFRERPAPDAAAYVQRAVSRAAFRHEGTVHLDVPVERVRTRLPATVGTIAALGDEACALTTAADAWDALAWHLMVLAVDLGARILRADPAELAEALEATVERARAALPPVEQDGHG